MCVEYLRLAVEIGQAAQHNPPTGFHINKFYSFRIIRNVTVYIGQKNMTSQRDQNLTKTVKIKFLNLWWDIILDTKGIKDIRK